MTWLANAKSPRNQTQLIRTKISQAQEAFAASTFHNIRSAKLALTIAYFVRGVFPDDGTLGFFDCDADRPDTDRTTNDIGRPGQHAIEMLTWIAAVGAAIIGATEEAG
jgi:hypothetical protein